MTIIQPNKNKTKLRYYVAVLIVIVFAGASLNIIFYSSTVDLKHKISNTEKEFHEFEVRNAELKNEIYSITNPKSFEFELLSDGLVLDKNPAYLELKKDDLAGKF